MQHNAPTPAQNRRFARALGRANALAGGNGWPAYWAAAHAIACPAHYATLQASPAAQQNGGAVGFNEVLFATADEPYTIAQQKACSRACHAANGVPQALAVTCANGLALYAWCTGCGPGCGWPRLLPAKAAHARVAHWAAKPGWEL